MPADHPPLLIGLLGRAGAFLAWVRPHLQDLSPPLQGSGMTAP